MSNLRPPAADGNCFYILTEDCAYGNKYFQAGNLCFCSERSYLRNFSEDGPPACFLKVVMLDDSSTVTINMEVLQPVRQEAAGFLLAIGSHSERLDLFLERLSLEGALRAVPGQNVVVEVEREFFPGVVRYIGSIYKPSLAVLTPVFFGVELQGEGENRGRSDGSYHGTEYFKCKRNCGIFLPFSKIQFIPTSGNDNGKQKPGKQDTEEVVPVKVGDAVSFYVDEIPTKGIAMAVYREGNQWFVKVCPEEEGTTDIFREIPMDSVVKESLQSFFPTFDSDAGFGKPNPMKREISKSSEEGEGGNSPLEVNSMVQITLDKGNQVSGIIRWLGYLPQIKDKMAGVELDEDKGVTAGEWLGKFYFHCAPKRGLFVRLNSCQPDMRFQSFPNSDPSLGDYRGQVLPEGPESYPPLRNEAAVRVLQGRMKGIQGHCNSCYMDAALFRVLRARSFPDLDCADSVPGSSGWNHSKEPTQEVPTSLFGEEKTQWCPSLSSFGCKVGISFSVSCSFAFSQCSLFQMCLTVQMCFPHLPVIPCMDCWASKPLSVTSHHILIPDVASKPSNSNPSHSSHSLFSCTSVLDSMLFMPFPLCDRNVQGILRDEIVNPLRRTGFVRASSVMHLREQLTDKGQCSSFTNAEKDPEEFLNLIMQQILGIEPLLRLQSGGQKEHECYCYQIFMDKQEDLVVPDVQQLVERSFLSSDLKLVEIPSCFIIQMPRFGKEYKMFSKIIPSLELDITDLLLDSPRECCLCGDVATLECSECFTDKVFAAKGLKQFCSSCSRQVHSHHRRKGHKPRRLHIPEEFQSWSARGCQQVPREKLELFAVLCIETSHYVSFVKYGPGNEHWMFFDSMADRHGGENGFNIPTVRLCPEVAKYLDLPLAVLALEQPRDMDGVAKRLFCDAYMYLYQSRKMALYK
ncbi:ubiquitin carboxyl-terminal hydrolase CYLD-like isoform X1 [Chamaea fasciata]|uniref:ubiquitin carboxyl-terminal hydrolase CYLD-like isoform X1 n=1 Tax=Chamaea fasciata TaxID=190680 RepID=UPI00336A9A2A